MIGLDRTLNNAGEVLCGKGPARLWSFLRCLKKDRRLVDEPDFGADFGNLRQDIAVGNASAAFPAAEDRLIEAVFPREFRLVKIGANANPPDGFAKSRPANRGLMVLAHRSSMG